MIAQLDRIAFWLNRIAGAVSGLLLVYLFGHIVFEIILRVGFSSSTYVLDEFVGYAVASMTFLSLSYSLDTGGLIRVDLVVGRTAGRLRRWIELFCISTTFAMTVFLIYWVGRDALRNIRRGAVSESIAEVPLWIPVGAVWLGLVLLAIQLFVYFLRIAAGGEIVKGEGEAPPALEDDSASSAPAEPGGR